MRQSRLMLMFIVILTAIMPLAAVAQDGPAGGTGSNKT